MTSSIILITTAEHFKISAEISHYCVVLTFIGQSHPHDIIKSIFILCTSCIVKILHQSHFNLFFNEIVVSRYETVC